MGAADIVPGVSGGTIAFITGIYERLISAISGFLPALFDLLRERSWSRFVMRSDLYFLLTLMAGILCSIVLFARLISWLLLYYPIPLWSAFFGLILASVVVIQRYIRQRTWGQCVPLLCGLLLSWWITSMAPAAMAATPLNVFLSGALAICAMILPGISGSFILVMLGSYAFVLEAIIGFDFGVLLIFAAGCLLGLLSIAQLLHWAFREYHDFTLAFLTGVMLGALNKVWPWREVLSERINRHGESVPLMERNVLPSYYEQVGIGDSQWGLALCSMVLATVLVLAIDAWSAESETSVTR